MILTNVQPSPIDPRDYKYPTATPAKAPLLPFSVDLREYAGDIEQQGQTGSCVANAAVSAMEILLTRQGQFENLSRLFHYWNLRQGYPDLASVDSGSYPRDAFKVANQIGICDETVWPFDESKVNTQPSQEAFADASAIKAFGYYSITMGWTTEHKAAALLTIKQAVSSGYPVLIAAHINEEFQQIYSTTLEGTQSQFVNAQKPIGAHAVLVVGYAGNSLLIENSWGTYWGCNGYALLPGPELMADTFEAWVCTGINGNQLPKLAATAPLGVLTTSPNTQPIADEYISGVVSLLHFNGANGSTSFKDSATALNWSALGDAVISTDQSKIGGSAYFKPSAGDNYLSTPSTPDLNMRGYDFTVELWIYPTSMAQYNFPIAKVGTSDHNNFRMGYEGSGALYVHCAGTGNSAPTPADTIVVNQWQHMALTRLGNTVRVFVNGILKGTWTDGTDIYNDVPLYIGTDGNGWNGFAGYIDEVRITKGQCRYYGDFTPSTVAFDDPPHWWTAAPNLTPIAAWDAKRVNGAQLLDGVGDNNITATSDLTKTDYPFVGVAGNSNPMALTTPVPVPSVGVVAGFWSPKRRNVLLSNQYSSTDRYMLHLSSDGNGWYSSNGPGAAYGQYGEIGKCYFVAMVTRGLDSILYVDGNLVGNPISAGYTMSHIGVVGYATNGNEFNLDSDEFLHAVGVWSGAATQDNVKAIEAAARLALAGAPTYSRGFAALIGRTDSNLPQLTLSTPAPNRFIGATLTRRDYQFGGNGRISGTIKQQGIPAQCRVQLYDETSKIMTHAVWSDKETGEYEFINIDPNLTYTIISYDHNGVFKAVISNGQKAVKMD
ncbi:Peptidase_C1 domain containing protein [uncultured Caudovirales phage]|uniref:Peptidase_C1 domain containing protein n=1 Tax=uncultured Caudovirales phage TaxID=2100421 RepID=A0A6J5LAR6_9CAUD|nr:Peptidase_C1 domain containing protein [uncultured Caudovirales phage]